MDRQTEKIELRLRTMRTLWFALFTSIGLYFMVTLYMKPSEDVQPNNTLSFALLGVALFTTVASFLIKSNLLSRATQLQQVERVQQAYVVALAITEVAAMLGLLDFFLTANRFYFIPFIIAAVGDLLHFPRRSHLLDASFKSPGG